MTEKEGEALIEEKPIDASKEEKKRGRGNSTSRRGSLTMGEHRGSQSSIPPSPPPSSLPSSQSTTSHQPFANANEGEAVNTKGNTNEASALSASNSASNSASSSASSSSSSSTSSSDSVTHTRTTEHVDLSAGNQPKASPTPTASPVSMVGMITQAVRRASLSGISGLESLLDGGLMRGREGGKEGGNDMEFGGGKEEMKEGEKEEVTFVPPARTLATFKRR